MPVVPDSGSVTMTSNWGTDQWNYTPATGFKYHWGIDLATNQWDIGATIVSTTTGTVVYSGMDPRTQEASDQGFGNLAIIRGNDENLYFYAHLTAVPKVSVGQQVEVGTELGRMGATGSAQGAHLHLEIWAHSSTYFAPGTSAASWWIILRPPGNSPETNDANRNPCDIMGVVLGCTSPNGRPRP